MRPSLTQVCSVRPPVQGGVIAGPNLICQKLNQTGAVGAQFAKPREIPAHIKRIREPRPASTCSKELLIQGDSLGPPRVGFSTRNS